MPFDMLGILQKVKAYLADKGLKKAQEAVDQLNLLLALLQEAGYEVGELEIELGLPPEITVHLKASGAIGEQKLNAILREHADKMVVSAIVATLLRANQLRGAVRVEKLRPAEIRIVLAASPHLVMSWKETGAAAGAAA